MWGFKRKCDIYNIFNNDSKNIFSIILSLIKSSIDENGGNPFASVSLLYLVQNFAISVQHSVRNRKIHMGFKRLQTFNDFYTATSQKRGKQEKKWIQIQFWAPAIIRIDKVNPEILCNAVNVIMGENGRKLCKFFQTLLRRKRTFWAKSNDGLKIGHELLTESI